MPDPFGITAGSTPPAGMAKYHVAFHAVPKPHPAFHNYSGVWTPAGGIVQVLASSKIFADEADCRSARDLYDRIKRQLAQVYGAPETFELIDEEATWPDLHEFWNALNHGERTHFSRWTNPAKLDADITQIDLMIIAEDQYDSSHVMIVYRFSGYQEQTPGDEYGLDSL
ncbi:hypothetical protein [Sphingobium sp. D43FB]|uniref:hypothetical protein n=1 Tax=Sphingobium sp. D43FB TaxID=2017595 RepID=UPI0011444959|nr:hypothetical protein [Sphingobium sp. D43FB]